MKTTGLLIVLLTSLAWSVRAQNERKFIRQGNKYFEQAMKDTSKVDTVLFNKAEIEYRKALDKKPGNDKWEFNLGDALYKQKKYGDSSEKFKSIADQANDKTDKAKALYNMGNSLLMNKKIDESIAAYKQALRNNPNDLEAKYNLLYAENLKKKQQKQQQQKQDKQNQEKNKDQNKDKDQQKKDQQNKDQQKQNQDQQNQKQDQQQQQQNKISRQNAEQMLQALENNEKKIQEKVKKEQALQAKSKKVDKNW
jgi:tetratricopeptide (TPR) repeat protein